MLITEMTPNLSNLINNDLCNPVRERSHTLPSMISRAEFIRNSAIELKRATPLINLHQSSLAKEIKHEATLQPMPITKMDKLNAKDYVYLGSSEMRFVGDVGITINSEGQLIMIQGCSHNLIMGLYHKYIQKKHHRCFLVHEKNKNHAIRFDALYINQQGKLLGKIKNGEIFYTINIEKNTKHYYANKSDSNLIITFQKYYGTSPEELSFTKNDNCRLFFSFKEGKIYLFEYANATNKYDYRLLPTCLTLPLPHKYQILSVKKTKGKLQIETLHKKKTRIYYLDPCWINTAQMRAKRLSHKPPQNLYSSMGADAHEKYDSGQPFSSTRLGNFSSKHIPLFSLAIDNFRVHWKKSIQTHSKRKYGDTARNLAKTLDPGLRALYSATKNMVTPLHSADRELHEIPGVSDIRNKYSGLIHELPDSVVNDETVAGRLSTLLAQVEENDRLALNETNVISAFCGIARGGIPFSPGYFFGLVAAISKTHNIAFEKYDKGNIRFSFINKRNAIGAALLGTGQGLEKTLLHRVGIDFFTIMPLEANIILSAYQSKIDDFSFDIKTIALPSLIEGSTSTPEEQNSINRIVDELVVNRTDEYGGEVSLEARIMEFRAQLGTVFEPNNYLVIPRTGGGMMLNAEAISAKRSQKKAIRYKTQDTQSTAVETTLKALSATYNLVGECKIMPIMASSIHDAQFYFPMPIIENSQKITKLKIGSRIDKNLSAQKASTDYGIHPSNVKYVTNMIATLEKIDNEMECVDYIAKLMKAKMTHPLPGNASRAQKKANPSLKKSFLEHTFNAELNNIKKELSQKQRDSMNKKISYFFTAKYRLTHTLQMKLSHIKHELGELIENKNKIGPIQQQEKIKQLQNNIKFFLKNAQYRLRLIEIRSVGELSKTKASIPNIIINFVNKKTFSYTKHLGDISFEYDESAALLPCKITCDYNFI